MKRILYILLLVFSQWIFCSARTIYGGEITTKKTGSFTYQVSVALYIQGLGTQEYEIIIDFGDGEKDTVYRSSLRMISGLIQLDSFSTVHKYKIPGTYLIEVNTDHRTYLVNLPDSRLQPFILQRKLVVYNDNSLEDSLTFHNLQTNFIYNNGIIIHDPGLNCYPSDSIVCSLTSPPGDTGYFLPSATEYLKIDKNTGKITWNKPIQRGAYEFCLKIETWRKGNYLGYVVRDMTFIADTVETSVASQENIYYSLGPNPAADHIKIFIPKIPDDAQVLIFNSLGKTVYRGLLKETETEIDVSGLKTGIYQVAILYGKQSRVMKLDKL